MSSALPGKKVRALIIVVAGLFMAYFISTWDVKSWFATDANGGNAAAIELASMREVVSDLDSDRDGLKDWQESLWGSDPKNADTDADGTRDGDEIAAGRDPKVAGPDDSLEKTRGISAASVGTFSATVSGERDNLTTAVSKDLFGKFMSLQTTGNLNDDTQAALISGVIADIDPGSIPPRYAISDLRIRGSSPSDLRAYGNEVASIVTTLTSKVDQNTANSQALASYDAAIKQLIAVQVPGSIGLTHLQILNNFNASYHMLTMLIDYEKDPVKGLVALKSLKTNITNGAELFATIALEFKNNDIIFDKTEAGYIWNNYR